MILTIGLKEFSFTPVAASQAYPAFSSSMTKQENGGIQSIIMIPYFIVLTITQATRSKIDFNRSFVMPHLNA